MTDLAFNTVFVCWFISTTLYMDVNYNRNVNSFNVNAIAHIILPDLTREQV